MDLAQFFGYASMITSLSISVVGFPAQIVKNFRRKSCEGISHSLVYSTFSAYMCWSLYGLTKGDRFIFISQSVGFFLCGIILIQTLLYPTKRPGFEKG